MTIRRRVVRRRVVRRGRRTPQDEWTTDEDGNLIDGQGRRINENGHLIDGEGRLIDEEGELVNEEGPASGNRRQVRVVRKRLPHRRLVQRRDSQASADNPPPTASQRTTVADYLGLHPFEAVLSRPESKEKLIACLQDAKAPVRAIGSKYSLSKVINAEFGATSGTVIDTSALGNILCAPYPGSSGGNLPANPLSDLLKGEKIPQGTHYLLVEAGIRIKDLLKKLKELGLGLETMGAGGGQSLAGAFSTGTHGGDFELAPLGDAVRAFHVIRRGAASNCGSLRRRLPPASRASPSRWSP